MWPLVPGHWATAAARILVASLSVQSLCAGETCRHGAGWGAVPQALAPSLHGPGAALAHSVPTPPLLRLRLKAPLIPTQALWGL